MLAISIKEVDFTEVLNVCFKVSIDDKIEFHS